MSSYHFSNIVCRLLLENKKAHERGHYDTRSAGPIAPLSSSTSTSASFSAARLLPITVALILLSSPSGYSKCAVKTQLWRTRTSTSPEPSFSHRLRGRRDR